MSKSLRGIGSVTLGTLMLLHAAAAFNSALAQCESAKLLASDGSAHDDFGMWSVGVSGPVAVVPAPGDDDNGDNSGSAYIFRHDGAIWVEEAKLLPSDGAEYDVFGAWVAVDGDVAMISACADDDNGEDSGSVYVFTYDGQNWAEDAKLLPSDGSANDQFGWVLGLDGDVAVIGAPRARDYTGFAYVFRYDGEYWVEEAKLLASDGQRGDEFGTLAVNGDIAVIGALGDGDYTGSAYVFRYDGEYWVEEAKLLASDGQRGDWFGNRVAVLGDVILVGAPFDNDNGQESGSAYVFRYDGSSWIQEAKLLGWDIANPEWFGFSVALSADCALIGAPGANDCGATYVFRYDGAGWISESKLAPWDGQAEDFFGAGLAFCDEGAVIMAPGDGDNGYRSGSAYVFDFFGTDCNDNGVCDERDISEGISEDCQPNGIPDDCDIANGTSNDYDLNGEPDECDLDCNFNGIPDACDIDCATGDCASHPLGCGDSEDCQPNGVPDECDIADGTSEDVNGNAVPDECECVGDLNGDGMTNHPDLGILLSCYGTNDGGDIDGDGDTDGVDLGFLLGDWGCDTGACVGDLDDDGQTGHSDLGILLAHWGEGCP